MVFSHALVCHWRMLLSTATPPPALPANAETLLQTPLHALHVELGARMVPFAGYSMPVQ